MYGLRHFLKSGPIPESLQHSAIRISLWESAGSAGLIPPAGVAGPGHTGEPMPFLPAGVTGLLHRMYSTGISALKIPGARTNPEEWCYDEPCFA